MRCESKNKNNNTSAQPVKTATPQPQAQNTQTIQNVIKKTVQKYYNNNKPIS